MKRNSKGIYQEIKESNSATSGDDVGVSKEDFMRVIDESFKRQSIDPVGLWVCSRKSLKKFHNALGDDGFYSMCQNLTTTIDGMEYVEEFMDRYEKD